MATRNDYESIVLPAYGIGETITLAAFHEHRGRVMDLADRLPYGPRFSRRVKDALRDMTVFVTRGDHDAAERYLLVAESAR